MRGRVERALGDIRANWPLAGLIAALTLAVLIISPAKPFWNDELYTYHFVAADSFEQLWSAYNDTLNNTPLVYFSLGWIWAKFFGAGELSLRMLSSLCYSGAAAVLWFLIRRYFGFWPAAFALIAVFCTSLQIFQQNIEARMYGLLMLEVALAASLYDAVVRAGRPTLSLLAAVAGVNALLVNTHVFGLIYTAALAAALFAYDLVLSRRGIRGSLVGRRGYYLASLAGASAFLLYLPAFLIQSQAGQPTSWIPLATPRDVFDTLFLKQADFVHPLALIILAALAALNKARGMDAPMPSGARPDSAHLIALALVLAFVLPVAVWGLSHVYRPLFLPRYLGPVSIGWIIILAVMAERCLPAASPRTTPDPTGRRRGSPPATFYYAASLLVMLMMTGVAVPVYFRFAYNNAISLQQGIIIAGPTDLPVVFQEGGDFLQAHHYASADKEYYFVLDWEAANTPESGLFGRQQHKHLSAWARQFPDTFSGRIVQSERFLAEHDAFVVVTAANYLETCSPDPRGLALVKTWSAIHCPQWVARRLAADPRWTVSELDPAKVTPWGEQFAEQWDYKLLLVRRSPTPAN